MLSRFALLLVATAGAVAGLVARAALMPDWRFAAAGGFTSAVAGSLAALVGAFAGVWLSRRHALTGILHDREDLQRIFDTVPVMIAVYDPRDRLTRVNHEFVRRVGWSLEEARTRSLDEDLFPDPEARRRIVDCRRRCAQDWTDVPMRGRSGATIQTSWRAMRLSDDTCLHLGIDITERRRAEEDLRLSEQRFRLLADGAPVMIWLSDAEAKCTWVNRPWLEFTGRTIEQELGDGWKDGVHPDDAAVTRGVFETAFASRTRFQLEYRHRRHDNVYRWLDNGGMPLFDAANAFTGYVGTCVDVDDRKSTEERLRHADRVKDEFLATLAHELRNPLAPIRNALAVTRNAAIRPHEMARAHDIIERQVARMSRLVDDLLDVSRITRGIVPLRRERIRLDAVIADAVEAARPRILSDRHEFVVQLPEEPLVLDADPARMAQVISNLLDNAAKYTPRGGRIELTASREGQTAAIRIRDNGIGLAPEQIQQIFGMFTRVASNDLGQGGLGIGLWLARKLVELHGGAIEASSAGPGQGSEFSVRLPLAASEAFDPQPRPGAPSAAGVEAGRLRVLVVEDNSDSAESMDMLLRQMGHEVFVAGDGRSGLHLAERERPDVVLLDIGLPELNGFEVARRIRLQRWGERIFLVALTGWGQEEDRRRSREAGFDHHLVKPVDPAALGRLLDSLGTLIRHR